MFKAIRIFILLFILAAVAMAAWRAKTGAVSWKYTLVVNVYPINGDSSTAADAYVRGLTVDEFIPIEGFMQEEARRFGLTDKASIQMRLQPRIAALPPAPPKSGTALEVILWSLQLRWWSYQNAEAKGPGPQVKLFVLYFDPAKKPVLAHSIALQKGLIGRVNVFASHEMSKQNNVIIAHEFLHTLGASDKYDLATNQPIFPIGQYRALKHSERFSVRASVREGLPKLFTRIWALHGDHRQITANTEYAIETGEVRAWHLVRAPRAGTYDKRIDMWLAPALQWYPVKLRYTEVSGDYLDLSLNEMR